MLALEINTNDTAVMVKVLRDLYFCFRVPVEYVQSCFFVKVDAPQTREKRESTE